MTDISLQSPRPAVPERIPLTRLVRLAARHGGRPSALARVLPQSGRHRPGRVTVAAFQSSV